MEVWENEKLKWKFGRTSSFIKEPGIETYKVEIVIFIKAYILHTVHDGVYDGV